MAAAAPPTPEGIGERSPKDDCDCPSSEECLASRLEDPGSDPTRR